MGTVQRRQFLLVACALLAMPGSGHAQARPKRIVFFAPSTREGFQHYVNVFRAGMKDLGYIEGRHVEIDPRWGNDRMQDFPALAGDIVALRPDVIVTASSAAVAAFQRATDSIPIVFAQAGRPVEQGFIGSLQRPGGNITGVAVHSLYGKLVEIVREALPKATRIGLITHTPDPYHRFVVAEFEASARRLKLEPVVVPVTRADELGQAFETFGRSRAQAIVVPTLVLFSGARKEVIALAIKAKIPSVSQSELFAPAGGLISYGPPREENYRRAALLVDKILKGAKPAELAVEQPERYQLVVNRRTAKAIAVELSPVTMLRADRIID